MQVDGKRITVEIQIERDYFCSLRQVNTSKKSICNLPKYNAYTAQMIHHQHITSMSDLRAELVERT